MNDPVDVRNETGVARAVDTSVCHHSAMAVGAGLTAAQHQRRRNLSRAWAIVVIAWAFGRTLVVWAAVGDYGINPWMYLPVSYTHLTLPTKRIV